MAVAATRQFETNTLPEQLSQLNQTEHQGIIDGNHFFDRVAVEQEALGLIANRKQVPKPEILSQEYNDNARTAIMEALTASGHLSRVEVSGSIEEIETQMLGRLLNGWDDSLPEHEQKRRFAELCNVLYGQKVRRAIVDGELPENTAVLELSDYPEQLAGTNIGYRDSNKKGMVRSSHLVNHGNRQYSLIIEQVSRSNATWKSTFGFLDACGVNPAFEGKPPDLAALELPLVYSTNDYAGGVVDIMRRLDQHSGRDVLFGDTGKAKAKHVSYDDLRDESKRREQQVQHFSDGLAKLEKQLDSFVERGQMTSQERIDNLHSEISRILAAICTLDPAYAEATFGERAAPSFYQAAELVARGQYQQAQALLTSTEHLRETITFCGASISVDKAKGLGLEVNSFGDLVSKGKEKWVWKRGVCQVKSCSTRPGETKVGPCSVCAKCQAKFDKGQDPTKVLPRVNLPKKGRNFQLWQGQEAA